MGIREIVNPDDKSTVCNKILKALPDWFAVEASIEEYTHEVRELPFYAAFAGDRLAGFLAVKQHNAFTAEVCVMGVLMEYQRQGIGTALINRAVSYCEANGLQYLTVKTLADTVEFEPYEKTRKFYRRMGFVPLEVFPLYWDADNPCLFLVKNFK